VLDGEHPRREHPATVNLLLVDPAELDGGATCTLRDRRALHLRTVLGATMGSHVRAGVVGGGVGTAELLADDGTAITVRLTLTEPAPAPLPIELVLAIPRPKVLSRVVEIAAAFGVSRIELTNAWRVDKSYLRSPRLAPDALALAARLGAEQGATTHLPEIVIHPRLMALLDARWPDRSPASPAAKLIAHPGALPIETALAGEPRWSRPPADERVEHPRAPPPETTPIESREPLVLAIGPEGGWIAREVDTFIARGFSPVSLGAPILRVEAAVAAALGQLLLLERLRSTADARAG
jgi:16S rRNA (uracil1498-N3)-methyltransferase